MSSLKDLEKRVIELESKVKKLEGNHANVKDKKLSSKKSKKEKNDSNSSDKKSKKKRKPNKFLIAMNEARKKKQDKFEYNGSVYKGTVDDKFGMIYRKEK